MWRRLVAALSVAGITMLVTHLWRGYPWALAALSGASLGALTFASLQTVVRLRTTLAQYGPRPTSPELEEVHTSGCDATPASGESPGAEPERHEEQEVGAATEGPADEEGTQPHRDCPGG